VIVGGSGHTVSMCGYTIGGGHSPMSRMFGLAIVIGKLLEVNMVTANGSLANNETIIVNSDGPVILSNNTDTFWAI